MAENIIVQFSEDHSGKNREQLEPLIDAEVERFNRFMQQLPDWKSRGDLHKSEKALLKSYLVARLTGKLEGT